MEGGTRMYRTRNYASMAVVEGGGRDGGRHHNAGEVDVRHHQHVELAEQGELVQRPRRLAVGLAGLPQVLDGPAVPPARAPPPHTPPLPPAPAHLATHGLFRFHIAHPTASSAC